MLQMELLKLMLKNLNVQLYQCMQKNEWIDRETFPLKFSFGTQVIDIKKTMETFLSSANYNS